MSKADQAREWKERIIALEARQERLQETIDVLSGYTTHNVSCRIRGGGPGECTCGLDDALDSSP